ncbi:MAG TPA: L-threonylcarbamoyladenylate synthase [Verrucomicrobiae bacterium]|jgi:L-threonylcarbamoyladenylate synthase|nr:L-threonylcarbamoyladenylate synthase [Verrucomicrobiae bacterium]
MKTEVLATHTRDLFNAAVKRAVDLLRAGHVVALPTETVYGLAANALDAAAVARIYEIKGRPANNPIIVHVASVEMAKRCVSQWPPLADKLARAFWPGPLTLVLPRKKEIPDIVTAGGETVAVRWPSHPFIQEVIRACDFPLAAPSANLSNRISPTNAEHVVSQLGGKIPLVVDGGQSQVGLESTVLDLTAKPPRLLRPGMIHEDALMTVTEKLTLGVGESEEILKSPGQLRKHYAPKAKLIVLEWRDDADLRAQLSTRDIRPAALHVLAHTHIPSPGGFARVSVIPHDAEAFARALYAELHYCDWLGAELIVVEAPPGEWRAIADRLRRASAE